MSARSAYFSTESTNGDTSGPSELEDGLADRDAVAVVERVFADRLVVHEGAVRRAEIGEEEAPVGRADPSVFSRGARVVEHDIALRQPPDRRDRPVERVRARAERQRRAAGDRCRLGLALDERGVELEPPLREVVVDLELDLGRADESPAALGGRLADDALELRDQRLLGLLELFAVARRQRE